MRGHSEHEVVDVAKKNATDSTVTLPRIQNAETKYDDDDPGIPGNPGNPWHPGNPGNPGPPGNSGSGWMMDGWMMMDG